MNPVMKAPVGDRRERLDRILLARGLADSREQAARLIMAGLVFVDGRRVDKSGQRVKVSASLEVKARPPFVSRGGEKLAHALDTFGISVAGRICVDVGASTGGFTHCLLSRGAQRVYAVDVGVGQLDARLRADPRVVIMERTNARTLSADLFPVKPDCATVDVSFISLEKVLPAIRAALRDPAEVLALVKPQFEVGKGRVGRGGVVRDPAQHQAVLWRLVRFVIAQGWQVQGLTASPLRGPKGNREFVLYLSSRGDPVPDLHSRITEVVAGAFGGAGSEERGVRS